MPGLGIDDKYIIKPVRQNITRQGNVSLVQYLALTTRDILPYGLDNITLSLCMYIYLI